MSVHVCVSFEGGLRVLQLRPAPVAGLELVWGSWERRIKEVT